MSSAPEINRTEKPGRKMMMPPSPVRCAPVPEAASNTEEGAVITNRPFIEVTADMTVD